MTKFGQSVLLYTPERDAKEMICYVMRFRDELEMLEKWSIWKSSHYMQPDVETGYNIFGFDLRQLAARIIKLYHKSIHEKVNKYVTFLHPTKK